MYRIRLPDVRGRMTEYFNAYRQRPHRIPPSSDWPRFAGKKLNIRRTTEAARFFPLIEPQE